MMMEKTYAILSRACFSFSVGGKMKTLRKLTPLFVLGAALVVTLGCSSIGELMATPTPTSTSTPKPTKTPKPTPTPVWNLVEAPFAGLAVSLPDAWTQINLDPAVVDSSVQRAIDKNPAMAEIIQSQVSSLQSSGGVLLGIDASNFTLGVFPAVMTIAKMDMGTEIPLETIGPAMVTEYESREDFSTSPIDYRIVDTMFSQAAVLEFSMNTTVKGQDLQLKTMQMLYVDGSTLYLMILACTEDQFGQYRDTFNKIVYSFQLTG
jgi:hypothetical protein